jgi:MinD-like ATPase involved in chromosome partitioning or flagellar assembly
MEPEYPVSGELREKLKNAVQATILEIREPHREHTAMQAGSSTDANALAIQMMKQVSSVREQATEQLEVARSQREELSTKALEKASEKQAEAAERKSNQIDLMA